MSTHLHAHDHQAHDIDFETAFTVTKEPGSQVKIVGDIPYSEVLKERKGALRTLGAHVELDGFRKGHVPEAMLVKHIGEMRILGEMAERTIAHMYPHILESHDLDAIGHPKVELTKLAPENPLGISILVAVMPPVTLPDYKQIASDVNTDKASSEVAIEEVETQINEILRQKIAYERLQAKAGPKTEEAATADSETLAAAVTDPDKLPLPELTNELVATLGQPGQFTDVADFRAKIKEHLGVEKVREVAAAHRAKLTDTIIEKSTIELPQVMIDSELGQMFAHMEEDLGRSNLKVDDYLAHIKKTRDDLKKDWTPAAEKRAKLQLILNEIAKAEKITPDQSKVADEVDALLKMHKDADPHRVTIYVESVLTNNAVLKMLEEVK